MYMYFISYNIFYLFIKVDLSNSVCINIFLLIAYAHISRSLQVVAATSFQDTVIYNLTKYK